MPQAIDEAGNIWETDAAGNPVRFVGRQGAGGGMVVPPDPARQARAGVDLQGGQLDNTGQGLQNQVTAATLPYAASKAEADAAKAQADAKKAAMEAAAAQKEQATATDPRLARVQQSLQTDSVLEKINRAREQIGKGWATGNVAGTGTFQGVPFLGQNSANLHANLEGLTGSIITDTLKALKAASASGASGMGSLTEKEGQRLAAAVAALQQTQDAESLKQGLADVERHYRNAQALLNNEDPRDPDVAARYGIMAEPTDDDRKVAAAGAPGGPQGGGTGPGGPPPPGPGGLTSDGKFVPDAGLKGANAHVAAMVRAGKTPAEIRAYLDAIKPGYGKTVQGIDEAVAYHRQHPDDKSPWMNLDLEKSWKPASGFSKAMGDIGMTAPGAAAIGAADMLSMGTLDNMTGNPDMARAVMGGVQSESPVAYALGQIGGGVASGFGIEAGLGRLGMQGIAGARLGDAAIGAGYGAGTADAPDDSRIAGLLMGGATGVAGGMAGRGMARGVGRALTGVQGAAQRTLNDRGVRMTPGQILGGGAKAWEDRLAGFPIVGDTINARRREGVQDVSRAAFEEALDPINGTTNGVIAEPGIEIARNLRSQAYDGALDPVHVQADAPFIADMQGVIGQAGNLPEPMRSHAAYTLPTRVGNSFDPQGNLTGRDYQQSLRGLRRDTNSMENLPYGYDFAQVTQGAEGALEGLLQRQSPGTVEALRAANEANKRIETLRAAVNASRNGTRSHQPGLPMPSQIADAAAATAKKFGNSHGTTNQPFFELTRAGQEVLPSQVPDSGTAGRIVIPAIAGSLAGGGSYAAEDGSTGDRASAGLARGAIVAALAAAPYSAPARAVVQRALLSQRPQAVQDLGNIALANNRIAGLLAAPGALVYAGD